MGNGDIEASALYKLNPAVFYRKYKRGTVVYHTGLQKVFSFNESAGDILDCFKDYSNVDTAIMALSELYEIEELNSFSEDISEFIETLIDRGILTEKHRQIERVNNLEKEFSSSIEPGEQLYSATIEVTYKCNERCRHCYIVDDSKDELSTTKIKSLLDELCELNVLNVTFTGGEFFIRNDAFDILEYAYSKRFLIDIFTNGNLIDGNDFIRLKRVWPRCVHFSLYSFIAEKHDAVTQIEGSFEKTLNSIRSCIDIGIPVNIKTPIFSETRGDIKGVVELADELGCSVELGRNITPKKNGDLSPLKMKISSEHDEADTIQTIRKLVYTLDDSSESLIRSDKLCGAGDRSISINPYGDVFPCNMLQIKIGNINLQAIKDIWTSSDRLKWWRSVNKRSLKNGCENCELANECVFCPGEAMMRTGKPLSKYDDACQTTKYAVNRKEV